MNSEIIYVFKCGCRAQSYVGRPAILGGQKRTARFCPYCHNASLAWHAPANRACLLTAMEGRCHVCGGPAVLSKNANTKGCGLFLCASHRHLRTALKRKARAPQNHAAAVPKAEIEAPAREIAAICPKCRARHGVSHRLRFSTQTPWKFCPKCRHRLSDA